MNAVTPSPRGRKIRKPYNEIEFISEFNPEHKNIAWIGCPAPRAGVPLHLKGTPAALEIRIGEDSIDL